MVQRDEHLVLADVGDQRRRAAKYSPQRTHHFGRGRRLFGRRGFGFDHAAAVMIGGPLPQARPPSGVRAPFGHIGERAERRPRIGEHGHVSAHDAAKCARVNVDVHDARAGRKVPRPSDDAVVEAHAHADDQIGVVHREIGLNGAVHAHHAERQWVLLGEDPKTKEGCADRDVARFSQPSQLFRGARHRHPVASHQQRPIGRRQHRRGLPKGKFSGGVERRRERRWRQVGQLI